MYNVYNINLVCIPHAAVPVSVTNAMCTYNQTSQVVKVEITRQQITSEELDYYEVHVNNGMKANVSAKSDTSPVVGLFYPVAFANKPDMANITTVDVCNQRSNPRMIPCTCIQCEEPVPTIDPGRVYTIHSS